MCLRSQGLVNKGSDNKGSNSNKDIRKDKAFAKAKLDKVVISSQP